MKSSRILRQFAVLLAVSSIGGSLTSQTTHHANSGTNSRSSNLASEFDHRTGTASFGAVNGSTGDAIDAQIPGSILGSPSSEVGDTSAASSHGGPSAASSLISKYGRGISSGTQSGSGMTAVKVVAGFQGHSAKLAGNNIAPGSGYSQLKPRPSFSAAARLSSGVRASGIGSKSVPLTASASGAPWSQGASIAESGGGANVDLSPSEHSEDMNSQESMSEDLPSQSSESTPGNLSAFETIKDPFGVHFTAPFEKSPAPRFERICGAGCDLGTGGTGDLTGTEAKEGSLSGDSSLSDEGLTSATSVGLKRGSTDRRRSRLAGGLPKGRLDSGHKSQREPSDILHR